MWVPRCRKKMWEGPTGKASGLAWTHRTLCVCAQHPPVGVFLGKYGPHGELFFFLIKKEPVAGSRTRCRPNHFVSAETLKACSQVGPHFLAAEGEVSILW